MASSPSAGLSILSLLPHSLQQGLLSVPSTLGHPCAPASPPQTPGAVSCIPHQDHPLPCTAALRIHQHPPLSQGQAAGTIQAWKAQNTQSVPQQQALPHTPSTRGTKLPHLPWLPAALGGIPAVIPGWPCSIRMGCRCSAARCMPEDAALPRLLHVPLSRMGSHPDPGRTC